MNNPAQPQFALPAPDMFVIAVPSITFPYIYEKRSKLPFQEFVTALGDELEREKQKEMKENIKTTDNIVNFDTNDYEGSNKNNNHEQKNSELARILNMDNDINNLNTPLNYFLMGIGLYLARDYVHAASTSNNTTYKKFVNKNLYNCKFCEFKTDSMIVLHHHMDTPHVKRSAVTVNYCSLENNDVIIKPEIIKRDLSENKCLYRFLCSYCGVENNQKLKLYNHVFRCALMFQLQFNLKLPEKLDRPAKTLETNAHSDRIPSYSTMVCEICDRYIPDLNSLKVHIMVVHKIKSFGNNNTHRPPLYCQRCNKRFYSGLGLERHFLCAHSIITNHYRKTKSNGDDEENCPFCGVRQRHLIRHLKLYHKMSLTDGYLSYKCSICTATFEVHSDYEVHVNTKHPVRPNNLKWPLLP